MKAYFRVGVEIPDGMTKTQMRDYIRDAVSWWGKQYEPPNRENGYTGDPRFDIEEATESRPFFFLSKSTLPDTYTEEEKRAALKWLRAYALVYDYQDHAVCIMLELRALQKRVAELEDALVPFAAPEFSEILGGNVLGDESIVYARNRAELKIGDFLKAKKLVGLEP